MMFSDLRPRQMSLFRQGGLGIVAAMDRTVARLNIEHYRTLLAKETDETKRRTLIRLLAEEEAKLAASDPPGKKKA